jgi:hypothetical protein
MDSAQAEKMAIVFNRCIEHLLKSQKKREEK